MVKITLTPLDKDDPIFKQGFITYSKPSTKKNINSTKDSEKNTTSTQTKPSTSGTEKE